MKKRKFGFLFQIGSIRSLKIGIDRIRARQFLFQIGSIRRYEYEQWDRANDSFYSRLVRLEGSPD